MNRTTKSIWDALTSLKLTIVCLAALMILVVACTLAQVRLGTLGAVNLYMRSWFFWMPLGGVSIPIFPGAATVGLVLMVNLVAAQVRRLELSWKKAGLWIVHAGLILLVVGEFVTGMYQKDDRLAFEVGQATNFVTSYREVELAVIDTTDPAFDDVHGIPGSLLARADTIAVPGTPITVRVHRWFENAQLFNAQGQPGVATAGVGTGVTVREAPPVTTDDDVNLSTALVEPIAGGKSYGTWLVSRALGAPQSFVHEGRTYQLELRELRRYLPYSLALRQFRHDVYPGTDIPKNFSSLVRLERRDPKNPAVVAESRDVLIYMNQPLRYDGRAFYQASFGKNDTLSILQVVENPGWLLPYVSCVLVTLGLLVHFGISLARWVRKQQAAHAAESSGAARTAVEA